MGPVPIAYTSNTAIICLVGLITTDSSSMWVSMCSLHNTELVPHLFAHARMRSTAYTAVWRESILYLFYCSINSNTTSMSKLMTNRCIAMMDCYHNWHTVYRGKAIYQTNIRTFVCFRNKYSECNVAIRFTPSLNILLWNGGQLHNAVENSVDKSY